jgi:hypothetical protein
VPKYSKIAQNSLLGSLLSVSSYLKRYFTTLSILVDLLLCKRIFERVGGVPLFLLKGWGPPLNFELQPTMEGIILVFDSTSRIVD